MNTKILLVLIVLGCFAMTTLRLHKIYEEFMEEYYSEVKNLN
jgi:hypothetical protein